MSFLKSCFTKYNLGKLLGIIVGSCFAGYFLGKLLGIMVLKAAGLILKLIIQ